MIKKHTPEQWNRINAFLKKAEAEKRTPESYYAHLKCEIELTAWEGFANLQSEFMSINPIVSFKYFITGKIPEPEPSKDMRKSVSLALIEVAKLGQVKRGQGLIREMKADVNYLGDSGQTALYHAIRRKRLGMAEMLLRNGADIYRQGKDSLNPLNLACAMGFSQAIPLFLKYGADINRPTKVKSWNRFYLGYQFFYAHPLSIAISQNQAGICQTLLDHGARMDLEIKKGFTIRDFVEANQDSLPFPVQTVFKPVSQKASKDATPTTLVAMVKQMPLPESSRVRS